MTSAVELESTGWRTDWGAELAGYAPASLDRIADRFAPALWRAARVRPARSPETFLHRRLVQQDIQLSQIRSDADARVCRALSPGNRRTPVFQLQPDGFPPRGPAGAARDGLDGRDLSQLHRRGSRV